MLLIAFKILFGLKLRINLLYLASKSKRILLLPQHWGDKCAPSCLALLPPSLHTKKDFFGNFMCKCRCLHASTCSMCISGAHRGKKTLSYPVEQELQMLVSHHVGAGNQGQVFCKSNKWFKLLSHLSSLMLATWYGFNLSFSCLHGNCFIDWASQLSPQTFLRKLFLFIDYLLNIA